MPDQSSAATEHALLQEITAPLQTLPDDPLALVEAEFPTAMRGYDRHAVDDYVAQVSELVAELHATRSPEAAVRRALERVGDQISGILQRAHETAESITAQSRAEAEDRLEQSRREAATMIDAAAQRVRELDADADRIWAERQRIVIDAEDLSVQLAAVAREAAERFPVEDPRGAEPEAEEEPQRLVEPETAGETEPLDDPEVSGETEPGVEPELLVEPEPADETEPVASAEAEADSAALPRLTDDDSTQITEDDSTRIIPPASDAAQHRHDG